ncbi:DUF7547 family protein [Natronorubrum halophilum]|uniref:DUF7547 family protein n=1 Tax=Natronorubrum halophilum TaxID=1702106 RepID=UPI0010C218A5|nr:hypothetical protein [Natronorubrum halophilum]
MADPDDELAEAVRELTRTIDDLRQELESTQSRSRFRPPAPRPPTPRELLTFTDEIAIPAAIAILKTSVRALEGFQRALTIARTEREVRDRTTDATDTASERARDLQRTTLSRLDTVLSELQRAASDDRLPTDDSARELLSEARELRDNVDRRLRDVDDDLETRRAESTDPVRIDVEDGDIDESRDGNSPLERDEPASRVDVDAELETLKDQYGADEDEDSSEAEGRDTTDGADESETAGDGDDADGPTNGSDETDVDALENGDDSENGDDDHGTDGPADGRGTDSGS